MKKDSLNNNSNRLDLNFLKNKNTITIAKNLLGKILVHETNEGILKGIILETEAYLEDDPASHSFNGKTKRNEVMFKSEGHLYVYFTYGMHYCLNIVTNKENIGEAVLIRSIKPIMNENIMIKNRNGNPKHISDGPAKLCQAFNISIKDNGINLLSKNSKIYLEEGNILINKFIQTERIGISKGKELRYRFKLIETKNKRK